VVEDRGLGGAPAGWLGSGARLLVGADLRELDRAADAAKYGRCSDTPALEVFEGPVSESGGLRALMVNAQWSPYALGRTHEERALRGWDSAARRAWQDAILQRLEQALPMLGEGLLARRLLTPVDWEGELGASEGSEYHGDMGLEQMFALRGVPLAGGGPHTGVERLLLCGAGAHPGGSLTGLPGWHAARAVLAEAG
jgi:phytoene dehydrogenase-like protein